MSLILRDYPIEIQERVKEIAGDDYDPTYKLESQFSWCISKEGHDFWQSIDEENFDVFFKRYPKQESPIERLMKVNEDANWNQCSSDKMFMDEFINDIEVNEPKVISDYIVEKVIESFKERSNVGIKKYGVTLDRGDLNFSEWLNHAQQESMDLILYLERMKTTDGMSFSYDLDEIDSMEMADGKLIIKTKIKDEKRNK